MNVYWYIFVVLTVGFCLSYVMGSRFDGEGGWRTTIALAFHASILGFSLSFLLPYLVALLCPLFGFTSMTCIRTDDQTVWVLTYPFLLSPLYWIVMLVSRAFAPRERTEEQIQLDAVKKDNADYFRHQKK